MRALGALAAGGSTGAVGEESTEGRTRARNLWRMGAGAILGLSEVGIRLGDFAACDLPAVT